MIALWGIDLPYNVKIGRRFRFGHHGCLLLGAREFGDDVIIQHSVTIGLRQRGIEGVSDRSAIASRSARARASSAA